MAGQDLTGLRIRRVDADVQKAASASGVKACLIGGGLFKLMGIQGYETPDLDYAATGDLEDGLLSKVEDPNVFSWNENGHFMVRGKGHRNSVKVDFIHKLSDGTKRLFLAAVRRRVNLHGVWCAPLPYAAAIRLAAAREKDIPVVRDLLKRGYVNKEEVLSLIAKYAPKSKGAKWLETNKL